MAARHNESAPERDRRAQAERHFRKVAGERALPKRIVACVKRDAAVGWGAELKNGASANRRTAARVGPSAVPAYSTATIVANPISKFSKLQEQ